MKCILTLEGAADRTPKILRVSDQEARGRVASGEATYISKAEWKRATRGDSASKEGVGVSTQAGTETNTKEKRSN